MFESISADVPELAKLQQAVTNLEEETYEAANRVGELQVQLRDTRNSDLDGEALALNRGRKPPKPRAPEVESQLQGAQRRWEVLGRRLQLAQSDLARYISGHSGELLRLAVEAKAAKAREVAELARPLAKALGEYQLPDLDFRALSPYLEGPAPENTSSAEPQSTTTILGPYNRRNVSGGERVGGQTLGQLEAIMGELASLHVRYEQGGVTIVGPIEDESSAGAA